MGLGVIHIPNALHITIHRLVYLEKLLELINKQCNWSLDREFHQVLENLRKSLHSTHCRDTQLVLNLLDIIRTQITLSFACNKEIEYRLILVCLPHKRSLTDTTTTRHYRKLSITL